MSSDMDIVLEARPLARDEQPTRPRNVTVKEFSHLLRRVIHQYGGYLKGILGCLFSRDPSSGQLWGGILISISLAYWAKEVTVPLLLLQRLVHQCGRYLKAGLGNLLTRPNVSRALWRATPFLFFAQTCYLWRIKNRFWFCAYTTVIDQKTTIN